VKKIDLIGIIPPFELVPSDVVKMNDADLIVIDGLNLEGGMEKLHMKP
jgi:ABC-type Zn uptake system ZnuABC Zn-binding protein ZnuA